MRVYGLFSCLLTSCLAAACLGARCTPAADGYSIASTPVPVAVTLACSAAQFFVLLAAFVIALGPPGRMPPRRIVTGLATAYCITILANTTRIVLGCYAGTWARATLPHNFWAAIHTGIGVFVFLSYLIATSALLAGQAARAKRTPRTTHVIKAITDHGAAA